MVVTVDAPATGDAFATVGVVPAADALAATSLLAVGFASGSTGFALAAALTDASARGADMLTVSLSVPTQGRSM
jgi:hypothetical protein